MNDSEEPASTAVVRAVAEREGISVTELVPLYDAVEPDALDRLCDHGFRGEVAFSYHGYRVVVSGDGAVSIRE